MSRFVLGAVWCLGNFAKRFSSILFVDVSRQVAVRERYLFGANPAEKYLPVTPLPCLPSRHQIISRYLSSMSSGPFHLCCARPKRGYLYVPCKYSPNSQLHLSLWIHHRALHCDSNVLRTYPEPDPSGSTSQLLPRLHPQRPVFFLLALLSPFHSTQSPSASTDTKTIPRLSAKLFSLVTNLPIQLLLRPPRSFRLSAHFGSPPNPTAILAYQAPRIPFASHRKSLLLPTKRKTKRIFGEIADTQSTAATFPPPGRPRAKQPFVEYLPPAKFVPRQHQRDASKVGSRDSP